MVTEEEIVSDDKYCQSQTAIRRKATSQKQQLMEHGYYEEIIPVLAHASFLGPICLGNMYFALSRYDDAMSCYTSALALQR
ncbi:hypothetical protein AMTRI_Chr04g253180 [Amborella trichopoda]